MESKSGGFFRVLIVVFIVVSVSMKTTVCYSVLLSLALFAAARGGGGGRERARGGAHSDFYSRVGHPTRRHENTPAMECTGWIHRAATTMRVRAF